MKNINKFYLVVNSNIAVYYYEKNNNCYISVRGTVYGM